MGFIGKVNTWAYFGIKKQFAMCSVQSSEAENVPWKNEYKETFLLAPYMGLRVNVRSMVNMEVIHLLQSEQFILDDNYGRMNKDKDNE